MKNLIFFFAKIFEKKEYAEDLINGKLFCNTLAYFCKYEEAKGANRRDKHEAAVGWHQPDKVEVIVNRLILKDLTEPVLTQYKWHDNIYLYCMYAATSGNFKTINLDNISEFRDHIKIPKDCLNLGAHAVIITNASEFINRVSSAIKNSEFGMKAGLVDYYDPTSFHGMFNQEYAMFKKRKEYQHQREYRIAIQSGLVSDHPIVLEVGSLRDIAVLSESIKVNSMIDVKLQK